MSASIFISHSARDPEGQAYLKAIVAGLAPSYDVWVDEERLKAGDDWGLVIANQFVECHGAVALFSTQALHSEYFRFEVDNLFARWMREGHDRVGTAAGGKFRFCLLLVPPLRVEEVKAYAFASATYLGRVNWTVATSPDDAVARVCHAFDGLTAWPSPLEGLEAAVKEILGDIKNPVVFLDAAQAGGFGPDDLRGESETLAGLARLYMRCPIERLVASLVRLGTVLGESRFEQLLDLLSPSWVPFEAGHQLNTYLCVTNQMPAARFAIISGEYSEFTTLMYLMRARRTPSRFNHIIQVGPPDVAGLAAVALQDQVDREIVSYITRWFAKNIAFRKGLKSLTEALAAGDRQRYGTLLAGFIASLVSNGGAVVVVIPAGPGDFPLVKEVSAQPGLEQVTFLALRDRRYDMPGDELPLIVPEVTEAQEQLAAQALSGFFSP
jgi:TIR domain-containing protein